MNKRILFVIIILALIIGIRASPLGDLITLENFKNGRAELETAVREHYPSSVLLFILVYTAVAALSIPGAAMLTLAGGFLFGPLPATLYVNIGATTGAVIAFLVVRNLLGRWVQNKYGAHLKRFNEELKKNEAGYLLTLRLIPAFPFFLVNMLSGLTRVPATTFAWTTAVGIIPGTLAYAYAGRQIVSVNTLSDVLSPRLLAAFTLLSLLALLPVLRKRLGSK